MALVQILARRSPAPVVVIDIGRSGEELFVVEFNGACSSGFYAADLSLWVAASGIERIFAAPRVKAT